MKTYKNIMYLISIAGLLTAVTLAFSNCGQVKFGSSGTTNKVNDVLTVDPGVEGQGGTDVPPGDGTDPNDPTNEPPGSGTPPGNTGGNDGEDDGEDDGDDHDGHVCHDRPDPRHDGAKGCKFNGIKDIIVNIARIEVRGTHGKILEITGDLGETSIISGELPISIAEDIDAVEIRLILNGTGNVLIDNDNKTFDLKTPSAQQSGLKIPFSGKVDLNGPGAYMLKFSLDPQTQVVHAGKKCLFKPVMKLISILPI